MLIRILVSLESKDPKKKKKFKHSLNAQTHGGIVLQFYNPTYQIIGPIIILQFNKLNRLPNPDIPISNFSALYF